MSWLCLPQEERRATGFRSRLSTPPGINQAIPPKLMSPKRLIGLGLFRVLLIGSCKHRGLYLIGSGTAVGTVRDRDFSAALKSNVISDSPSISLFSVSLNFLVWFIMLFMFLMIIQWIEVITTIFYKTILSCFAGHQLTWPQTSTDVSLIEHPWDKGCHQGVLLPWEVCFP